MAGRKRPDVKARVKRRRMVVPWRTAKHTKDQNHSLPAAAGITRMARIKLAFLEISEIGGFSVVLGLGRNDKRFGRKAIDAGLIRC